MLTVGKVDRNQWLNIWCVCVWSTDIIRAIIGMSFFSHSIFPLNKNVCIKYWIAHICILNAANVARTVFNSMFLLNHQCTQMKQNGNLQISFNKGKNKNQNFYTREHISFKKLENCEKYMCRTKEDKSTSHIFIQVFQSIIS